MPVYGRFARRRGFPVLAGILQAGCASTGSERLGSRSGYGEPTAPSALSNEVLMRAISLVGTPYRYGGNSPEGGFDCSGLVDYVFLDAAGLRLPRSTRELIELDVPEVRARPTAARMNWCSSIQAAAASATSASTSARIASHAPSAGGDRRLDTLNVEYWKQAPGRQTGPALSQPKWPGPQGPAIFAYRIAAILPRP
jgi:hypothetical protein